MLNISGDYRYIGEIIDKYVPEMIAYKWMFNREKEFIKILKESKKKIIIFGAGVYGKRILRLCKNEDVSIEFFCDNDRKKQHTQIQDVRIISLEELLDWIKMCVWVYHCCSCKAFL